MTGASLLLHVPILCSCTVTRVNACMRKKCLQMVLGMLLPLAKCMTII